MRRTQRYGESAGSFLVVGVFLLSLAGSAPGAKAGDDLAMAPPFDGAETTTQSDPLVGIGPLTSFRITGSAFKPRETDVTTATGADGGCAYVAAGDSTTVWNVSPNLPQGAVVATLRMYSYDTSTLNTTAWFTVYDLYGSVVQEWPVSSSTSAGSSFDDSALIQHTIDYNVYSYLINWRPYVSGNTMQLCGIRLFYVAPTIFSDGFESGDTSAWN